MKGEAHGRSSMTDKDALLIKEAIKQTDWKYGSGRKLAEQFGVSEYVISKIRSGKAWAHL
jgi:hypothetical protein